MQKISFDRHRFPADLIIHAVWLYAKFTLSYRDVEDLLAERGLDVSYETVRRWFLKFGDQIATRLRSKQSPPSDHWHLDEMVIVVCGKRYWLWRAVDNEGMAAVMMTVAATTATIPTRAATATTIMIGGMIVAMIG